MGVGVVAVVGCCGCGSQRGVWVAIGASCSVRSVNRWSPGCSMCIPEHNEQFKGTLFSPPLCLVLCQCLAYIAPRHIPPHTTNASPISTTTHQQQQHLLTNISSQVASQKPPAPTRTEKNEVVIPSVAAAAERVGGKKPAAAKREESCDELFPRVDLTCM